MIGKIDRRLIEGWRTKKAGIPKVRILKATNFRKCARVSGLRGG